MAIEDGNKRKHPENDSMSSPSDLKSQIITYLHIFSCFPISANKVIGIKLKQKP